MKLNKETYIAQGLQLRDDGSRMVTGRAVVFNSDSSDMGFIERISPEAITSETIKNSDIFALFNHNRNDVLARSNHGEGTLILDVDNEGVNFVFEAPNTTLGNDLLELVRRGDINGCSFCFTISPEAGSEKWYRDENNQLRRDIKKIDRLFDISIVTVPAYPETSVSARSKLDEVSALDEKLNSMLKDVENLKDYE